MMRWCAIAAYFFTFSLNSNSWFVFDFYFVHVAQKNKTSIGLLTTTFVGSFPPLQTYILFFFLFCVSNQVAFLLSVSFCILFIIFYSISQVRITRPGRLMKLYWILHFELVFSVLLFVIYFPTISLLRLLHLYTHIFFVLRTEISSKIFTWNGLQNR
jgi:hypothetical protein